MSDADAPPFAERRPKPLGPVAIGLTVLTSALWGGTPTAVKYTTDVLPPITISGIRFALAAAFMLAWCLFERTELRLRRGQVLPALGAGLFLYVQIMLFTYAIALSNASHSTLFINTFIFWVLLIEHFFTRHDRLTGRKLAGLLAAAIGVFVVFGLGQSEASSHGDASSIVGDSLMLTSAAILAVKIVYTKWATRTVEPTKLILWHDVIGVSGFAVTAALVEDPNWSDVGGPAILGLLYQGVLVGGFCFGMQAVLLKHHSASQITVFSFATPLFGTVIAVLFRNDPLSPWLFVGAVCVVLGIFLVTTRQR